MDKVRRIYVTACVLGINVLLLLAVSNCAALYYNRHRDKMPERSPHIAEILDKQPELLKLIYPDQTPDQVRTMLNEIWNLTPTYELFTQYRELPHEGEFVNVDPRGFRRIKDQGPWPPDAANYNVFMFGGSTTFGYGVQDRDTVPSQLQEILREQPGHERRVCVYNWGRGGYYSSQERALFEVLLLQGHIPDAAVFMDGLNDFGSFGRERHYAETFRSLMASYTGDQFVSGDLVASLPLVKLLTDSQGATAEDLAGADAEDATSEFVVARYLGNKKMLTALCAAYDIDPLFVWQPVQHWEYYPPIGKQVVDVKDLGQRTYAQMKALHERGETGELLWLADLQAAPEHRGQLLYVDAFHYTGAFGRAIAAAMAREL